MKKGFTLIEMLAVILILGVILLIGVPIYQGIQKSTNESIYNSKIANVKSKAEAYSAEAGTFIYDIRAMIEWGLLTPDNESGEYLDPRDGRDMKCDIVQVSLENDQYYASVSPGYDTGGNARCYTTEELQSMNSIVQIKYYKNASGTEKFDAGWIKADEVYAGYEFIGSPEVSNVVATWGGVGTPLESGMLYITSMRILNTMVQLHIEFDYNGKHIAQDVAKAIKIDNESPVAKAVNGPGSEVSSNLSYVEWNLTDGEGSGVAGHVILNDSQYAAKKCSGYTVDEIPSSDKTVVGKHLNNGTYYVCVKDNVGNITKDEEITGVVVSNVDQQAGDIKSFVV